MYDIGQTFSSAISYNIPAPGSGVWKSILGSWSTDSIVYARTAPPVNVVTGLNPFPTSLSGANSVHRSNLVPGVPVWISDPNVAGGKPINPAALSKPVAQRFDAAEAVQTLGASFSSGAGRSLQHLQHLLREGGERQARSAAETNSTFERRA